MRGSALVVLAAGLLAMSQTALLSRAAQGGGGGGQKDCTLRPANCSQSCGNGLWNEWVQLTPDGASDASGEYSLISISGPCGSEWKGFTCSDFYGWRGTGTSLNCTPVIKE